MAALTFVVLFSFSWIFVLAKKETPEVKVKAGEDATLECLVAPTMDTTGWVYWVHWDRLGQKDNFVFVRYRNISYVQEMLPRYRGAVEMKDPELKDGDATVILRNVDISDAGTYECRVLLLPKVLCRRIKPDLISTIRLTVTERGHTAGHKEGGDKEGGDKGGGDKEGVNTDGGDKKGGDKKGGDKEPVNTHGGDQKGGNKEEGDKQGGDQEGGDKEGGDKEGVNTDGGDKKGGNKEEGDKQGGDQEGGDKEGVITDGGDKKGGNKEEGDKQGGDQEGGDKEGDGIDGGNKDVRKAEGNRSFLHSRENVGLVVDLLLGALLVAVVVVAVVVFRFIICRKYKVLTEINSY